MARNQPPGPPVRVDVENEWVWCGEQRLKLTPKAFAVVRYLAEHAGKLVTKDQLLQVVWPDTVVSEWALTSCLREIRKTLKDTPRTPQYIETVHRRGFRFIGPVGSREKENQKAKGKNQKAKIFSTQSSVLSTQSSVLVGRETELAQLHQWLDKALAGERQIVFVTGEPGIGKTSLIETFLYGVEGPSSEEKEESQNSKVKGQKSKINSRTWDLGLGTSDIADLRPLTSIPWIARGQCIEHFGAGEAYLPVLEALGRLGREPGHDRLMEVLHQYAPTWLVQMPALLNPTELEALQRKVLGATRERMLREMAEALEALTAERGLVLWFEDLHWSDYSTLDLISSLARRPVPARLLVLGTYRPIDVIVREHPLKTVKQELELHGHCEELPLELLPEAAVAEYLAARFAAGLETPASLQRLTRLIYQRTEGNPLFMVAVVDELLAQSVLVQREGRWELAREVEEGEMPASLRHFIELQVERLSPEEQQVLEAGSAAGIEFSAAAVAAGIEGSVETIEKRCEGLARREQFLRLRGMEEWPDGTVAARYSFLHALYQEVIYRRLSVSQLTQLHQRIGKRLEVAYDKRSREIAAELAVHFERGRKYRKTIQYLQQAGENATQRSAYQEATSHLTRGLELLKSLPDTPERIQQELPFQITLGSALAVTRGYAAPEVKRVYTRARELCQQLGETPQLFPVLWGLWNFYLVRGELQTARELGEQLLSLAQHVQDPALLLEAHDALGQTLYCLGEFASARAHLEQGIALYDPQQHHSLAFLYGGEDPGVACLTFAAQILWYLGYSDQARGRIHGALTLAQELSHPHSLALALANAAGLNQSLREEQATQGRAEAVMRLATEQEFPYWLVYGTALRGWALAKQGQEEEGIAQVRWGMAAWQDTGSEVERTYYLALLAEAYEKAGQADKGLAALADAAALVEKTGDRRWEAEVYRLRGTLTLQSKVQDPKAKVEEEAEECFRHAIEIARRQEAKSWELRASTSLARLWQQQGKKAEAHDLLSEIYNWFTEGFDTKDLQEARALLDELHNQGR